MAAELASPLLSDALVILGAAGLVIPVFARFRITPIIGFILVGIAVGPYGLGRLVFDHPWLNHVTITDPERLEPFAEFGIILLLFSIGLELSFDRLWQLRKRVFGLGSLELMTIAFALTFVLSALMLAYIDRITGLTKGDKKARTSDPCPARILFLSRAGQPSGWIRFFPP